MVDPPLRGEAAVDLLLKVGPADAAGYRQVSHLAELIVQPADDLVGGGNGDAQIIRHIVDIQKPLVFHGSVFLS